MRILASITAVLLFLFLLASAPAFSQEGNDKPDHPQDEKSKDKDAHNNKGNRQDNQTGRQDEGRRDDSHPAARENETRPETARPQEQTRPQQTRPEDRRDEHAGRPQERARPEGQARPQDRDRDQRAQGEQRRPSGGRGRRIPDDRFRSSFGREHHFRVDRARIVNQPQPVVVYSGYSFQLAEPWPAEWSYDDDYYVDYIDDDYYMYDAYHPGIRILVYVIGD